MAKAETTSFLSELTAVSLYKRNQGRLARQLTAGAIALAVLVGAYSLSQSVLNLYAPAVQVGIPILLAAAGIWFAFRVVNYPKFAEFLIAVEGEMNKVSWSSRSEVYRATIVVLVSMFSLAAVLLLFDTLWMWLLTLLGVLRLGS